MDLKIAAIVLNKAAILLTRNIIDFSKVERLQSEDWSII
jgi:predicted nucleic acid-binding protein